MCEALAAESPDRIRLWLARHEGDLVAATIAIRVGAHAWYSYGASSTEKRDVRGSNAIQWAMIRDAIAAGADVYDLRGITDTLDADDSHVGLIQFKVGTGGEAVEYAGEWDLPLNRLLYKAFDALHEAALMSLTLTVDGDRWRAHLRASPTRHPGPGAGRQGQRLRLHARPAGPQGPVAGRRTPSRSAPTRSCPRSPTRFDGDLLVLTPWRPFVDDRSTPPSTDRVRPHRQPTRRPRRAAGPSARCPARARADDQHAAARPDRARAVATPGAVVGSARARLEGVALHLPLAQGSHLARGEPAAQRRRRRGPRRRTHHLGQPPHRRRARPAADVVRRLHVPAPHRHRPVARRPRRAEGHRHGARRARGRAGRRVRLPRPDRAQGRPPAGRQRRHRPRHRPGGRRWASRRCKARAATVARGGLDAVGFVRSPFSIDGKQRLFAEPPHMQASMLFLPGGAAGARRSATRSTCGCATPRRRSTG